MLMVEGKVAPKIAASKATNVLVSSFPTVNFSLQCPMIDFMVETIVSLI